jgi:hypothetical protein
MEQISTMRRGFAWCLAAAALAPFAVAAIYLFSSRHEHWNTPTSDNIAGAFSILIGVGFVATFSVRLPTRIFLLLIYIPVLSAALFYFSLAFVGIVFNDWM